MISTINWKVPLYAKLSLHQDQNCISKNPGNVNMQLSLNDGYLKLLSNLQHRGQYLNNGDIDNLDRLLGRFCVFH
jgi:hypothetical protein